MWVCIWPIQWHPLGSRLSNLCFSLPIRVWYQFIRPRGMEGTFGLSGKPKPWTWDWAHATVGTSADYAATRLLQKECSEEKALRKAVALLLELGSTKLTATLTNFLPLAAGLSCDTTCSRTGSTDAPARFSPPRTRSSIRIWLSRASSSRCTSTSITELLMNSPSISAWS